MLFAYRNPEMNPASTPGALPYALLLFGSLCTAIYWYPAILLALALAAWGLAHPYIRPGKPKLYLGKRYLVLGGQRLAYSDVKKFHFEETAMVLISKDNRRIEIEMDHFTGDSAKHFHAAQWALRAKLPTQAHEILV